MKYYLTEKQKDLARQIAQHVGPSIFGETLFFVWDVEGTKPDTMVLFPNGIWQSWSVELGALEALDAESLIRLTKDSQCPWPAGKEFLTAGWNSHAYRCTITGKLLKAIETDFSEEETIAPVSTLAQPHPPEIAMSLDRLRTKYPDPKTLGFLVMRFTAAKPFARIVETIKQTAEKHGLKVVRADENEFHADLWGNVRTHLHGCGFGIAVYERIETDEPNANVGLEVGYLMAMNKPVFLLKDKTVEALQADLAGKLYKPFDPHDPEGTIPNQLAKWLEDYGIIIPKHT